MAQAIPRRLRYDAGAMPPGRVFLLRHAQSTFNASWDATGVDPGEIDAPLTDAGHAQVASVASMVRALEVELVIASPTTRALQTVAGIYGSSRDVPPLLLEPLLRDRLVDSCDFGRSPAELAVAFPSVDFGQLADNWWLPHDDDGGDGPPLESREAFAVRIATLRSRLLARSERSLLVVGHRGTFQRLAGIHVDNCQLVEWSL